MKLNRPMQLEVLTTLREAYPEEMEISSIPGSDQKDFQGNLFYLLQYGLVHAQALRDLPGRKEIFSASITAKGLDFLEDDGGIGAVLASITVKFDAENIRSLLEDKILASALPTDQKQTLAKRVRGFSGDVLKSITLKLLERALEHPEQLITLLGNL